MSTLDRLQIAELNQLEARVQTRLLGIVQDLQLIAQERGVVLRGRSRTYYGKQLAQQAIMQAAPMPLLANEIQVD